MKFWEGTNLKELYKHQREYNTELMERSRQILDKQLKDAKMRKKQQMKFVKVL